MSEGRQFSYIFRDVDHIILYKYIKKLSKLEDRKEVKDSLWVIVTTTSLIGHRSVGFDDERSTNEG